MCQISLQLRGPVGLKPPCMLMCMATLQTASTRRRFHYRDEALLSWYNTDSSRSEVAGLRGNVEAVQRPDVAGLMVCGLGRSKLGCVCFVREEAAAPFEKRSPGQVSKIVKALAQQNVHTVHTFRTGCTCTTSAPPHVTPLDCAACDDATLPHADLSWGAHLADWIRRPCLAVRRDLT